MRRLLLTLIFFAFSTQMNNSLGNPLFKDAVEAPPIVYWASLGRIETVKQLLAGGASPSATDAQGWSALQAAAENGHLEIVKILVKAGANLNYVSAGKTALQLAQTAKQGAVVEYLKSIGAK
jgi:uncharacterized protein